VPRLLLNLFVSWAVLQTSTAFAQEQINLMTTFSEVGSSSRTSAIITPKLAEYFGQPVHLQFSTDIHTVVGAPADGTTLFVSTIGIISLMPNISASYGVDPLHDLRAVTRLTATPDVLIARAGLGLSDLDELVSYAHEHPGVLRYSYIAPTSIHRVEFSAFFDAFGIEAQLDESIRGSQPAMDALESGAIDFAFTTAPYVAPLVASGAAVPIVVAHPARIPLFPGVPTMAERGISGIPHGSWAGVFVPAGTSDAQIARIFAAVTYAMEDPGVIADINALGMEISLSESPAEFAAYIGSESARLKAAAERYDIVAP
jgi:tripartite-type tricarboxylate transporter receptor subunit TctC